MGMAASQGRLLSITSRMSDVEFASQQKCQTKIKLAMQTEDITRQYTDAINKKKFVVNTGYENGVATTADLSYDLLTGLNSPMAGDYCLADSANRILVPQDLKDKFLSTSSLSEFLKANNADNAVLVTPAVYPSGYTEATYTQQHTKLEANVAAAKTTADSTPETITLTAEQAATAKKAAQSNMTAANTAYNSAVKAVNDSKTSPKFTTSYSDADMLSLCDANNGTNLLSDYNDKKMVTLALTGDSFIQMAMGQAKATQTIAAVVDSLKTKLGGTLVSELSQKIGGNSSATLQKAVDAAAAATFGQFAGNEDLMAIPVAVDPNRLKGTNNLVRTGGVFSDHAAFMVDMQQVIATFLSYFDKECQKSSDSQPPADNVSKISEAITIRSASGGTGSTNGAKPAPYTAEQLAELKSKADSLTKVFNDIPVNGGTIHNPAYDTAQNALSEAKLALTSLEAGVTPGVYKNSAEGTYYTNIYNRMCQGYTTMNDEKNTINNKDWLYNQLKNGGLYLEQFGTDGKATDKDISANSEISEVKDDKDVDIIKAKYDCELLSIQTKDKKLDMDIKQLDTEHSALQTEVESVQKVIQKNVESSFKTFG